MEKIVVKTAVKTVLIILAAILAVFAVFNFAFPQHMATLTEGMGNYSLAIKYASLRYSYTHDGEDLARCFDDAVLWKNDKYIIEYGEELIKRYDFSDVCESKNKSSGIYDYKHRVYGKLAVSYYNTGKKSDAVLFAASANEPDSFVYGNALMSLAVAVRAAHDSETCGLLIEELEKIHPVNEQEISYLNQVIASLRATSVS